MVLLLRLAPVVPFAALNYAMGATSVGLWPYTWASALGIVPGAAPHLAPHLHLALSRTLLPKRTALNYTMGATSVRLWPCTWASALGTVPGAARCMPDFMF